MAFDWIKHAGTRRFSPAAWLTAATLTAAMVMAISSSLGIRIIDVGGIVAQRAVVSFERLTYAIAGTPAVETGQLGDPTATIAQDLPASASAVDTGTAPASRSASRPEHRGIEGPLDDRPMDPRLRPPLPRLRADLHPPTYDITRALTQEQRDSALKDMTMQVPVLVSDLKPTQAQRDSAARELASLAARYRDQGRPMPIPLGGVGIGLFGKSREERRRDSIIHSDNTARLRRLVARVQAKQDSARRADSIAALKTQKVDSTDD